MTPVWLVLNIGSSTIKFGVYAVADGLPLARGAVEAVGLAPKLKAVLQGEPLQLVLPERLGDTRAQTRWLLSLLEDRLGPLDLRAAGHRVVHGGAEFAAPTLLDAQVITRLEALSPLAPGHQPYNLAGIAAVAAQWPGVPQVACFDTAFHQHRTQSAKLYALPRFHAEAGILRYGFHGLSYDYIAARLPEVLGPVAEGRVIVAHLGSGASLCAMRGRRSVETTMGFSALDGLVMGTRCGQIDPGVLLHLMRQGMDAAALERLLGRESGLLGVSGLSSDMRDLLESDRPEAAEAVELFVAAAVRQIGGLVAGLGGLDALVFTAGIGQHTPAIRARILQAFGFLGLKLDAVANAANAALLSTPDSAVAAAMIPTNEEAVILAGVRQLTR